MMLEALRMKPKLQWRQQDIGDQKYGTATEKKPQAKWVGAAQERTHVGYK
jgi:hypothetical protein